jgi:hypothetical protein
MYKDPIPNRTGACCTIKYHIQGTGVPSPTGFPLPGIKLGVGGEIWEGVIKKLLRQPRIKRVLAASHSNAILLGAGVPSTTGLHILTSQLK